MLFSENPMKSIGFYMSLCEQLNKSYFFKKHKDKARIATLDIVHQSHTYVIS